jgi:hypothetical protein
MQKPHIIEITSGVNAAIYSAISDAIGKAPAPIKAGLGVGLGGLDAVCEIVVDFFCYIAAIFTAKQAEYCK